MVLRVTEILTQNCLKETIIFSHTREFWDGKDLKTGNSYNSQYKSGGRQFAWLHSAVLWIFPTGQSKMAAEIPHDRVHRKFSQRPRETSSRSSAHGLTLRSHHPELSYTLILSKRRRGKDYPALSLGPCLLEKLLGGEGAGNLNKMGGERWKRVF